MGKFIHIWFPIALVIFGISVVTDGQSIWDRLEKLPMEMYKVYGNPAENALNGFPRLLLENQEKDEDVGFGFYLPSSDESVVNNSQCVHDTQSVQSILSSQLLLGKVIGEGHIWPLTMTDSWGLPGDGILNGNSLPWGFIEECMNVKAKENFTTLLPPRSIVTEFQGKYCLVHIENQNSSSSAIDSPEEDLEMKVRRDILTSAEFYYYGTCMPSSCTEDDLEVSVAVTLEPTTWKVIDVQCQVEEENIDFTSGDLAFIIIVGIIWSLAVSAALLEFLINLAKMPNLKKGPLKFWLAFSSYRNMSSIFRIFNKTNPDVIDCLHGLRAMSMIWVTWCHSYQLFVNVTQNMKGLQQITDSFLDQIIFNGSFSVDTFFFMSGLLATYSILREKDITGKVNWIMYYVHRLIRLMPAIALTCFFMATVAKYALVGPYGPYIEKDHLEPCRSYWFMDVLFASNFADDSSRCLPQSWYTAVDTQLYIILPLVLVPLISKPKFGLIALSILTAASFIIPTSLYAAYDLKPLLPLAVPEVDPETTTLNNDLMPWNRASPYFMGVWAGFILFTYKDKKITIPWYFVVLGWCVSITVSCLVLFGLTPYNTLLNPTELPSWIAIAYGGFSRGAWGLSLLWVVFACQKGFAGPVNTFLGHASWLPMSRLAFSMFLITVPVQLLSSGSTFVPMYMNHLNKFIETSGYLFVGGLMAIGVAITSELPILALEKLIIRRPGRNVLEEPLKES